MVMETTTADSAEFKERVNDVHSGYEDLKQEIG